MAIRRFSLVMLSLIAAGACDLEAGPGQEIVLGNRGMAVAFAKPNAVTVQAGGSVVVQDADVSGRGAAVMAEPRALGFWLGEGIVTRGGRVRIVQGHVSGGNALVLSERSDPVPNLVMLAPALQASDGSTIEILGGTLASSGVFLASGVTGANTSFDPRAIVSVSDSNLLIQGGTLRGGERQDAGVTPGADTTFPLDAERSNVEIAGGDFTGGSAFSLTQLRGSRSRIRGGIFEFLVLVPAGSPPSTPAGDFQRVPGCTEIRGGSFNRVSVVGDGERLIVYGSGFNRPLGPLPTEPATLLRIPISGTLEAGNFVQFILFLADGTQVSLAAPGSPGCS
jgi:hypothetical protein